MIPVYRVSNVAQYARWKEDDESEVGWLVNSILSEEQTPAMAKGTAFHKYLEHAQSGADVTEFTVDGFRFVFTADIELSLPPMREIRLEKDYGGIIISGCSDAPVGNTIIDHKTTERFDAENYLSGWQWRYYLDLFGADRFVWNVFEMSEVADKTYEIWGYQRLEQFRYAGMERDCQRLAQEFRDFAAKWIPRPITLNDRLRASIEATA